MNEKQKTYMFAKAYYDTLKEQIEAEMKQHRDLLNTEQGIEKYYDIEAQLDKQVGLSIARQALTLAEKDMIAWAKSVLKRKHPAQFAQVAFLYESKRFDVYNKLVDLSFRLAE